MNRVSRKSALFGSKIDSFSGFTPKQGHYRVDSTLHNHCKLLRASRERSASGDVTRVFLSFFERHSTDQLKIDPSFQIHFSVPDGSLRDESDSYIVHVTFLFKWHFLFLVSFCLCKSPPRQRSSTFRRLQRICGTTQRE